MAVKIGLVGTGTVGGGCIDIIQKHRDDFKRHYGVDIELVRVCSLDRGEAEAHGVGDLFTNDFNEIINDPDIDLVIELIGGTGVAHTIVCDALRAGKYVVTANKALMATAGEEISAATGGKGIEGAAADDTDASAICCFIPADGAICQIKYRLVPNTDTSAFFIFP